jgi:hypothetical protein
MAPVKEALGLSPWLSRLWFCTGWVGMAATIVGMVLGWQLLAAFSDSTRRTLDLMATTLETTVESTTIAIETLASARAGMAEAETALDSAGTGLEQLSGVMTEMAFLLGGDVPDTLDAIQDSFPAMIDTARVIDRTMSALSILGVDYSPETPLDGSLQAVEDELGPLAVTLRQQAIPLAEAAADIETVGTSVRTVGNRVNDITTQLTGSTLLVEHYQAAASEAGTVVDDLRERLVRQLALARALMIVLGLTLLGVMTIPITLGRSHRSINAPDHPIPSES